MKAVLVLLLLVALALAFKADPSTPEEITALKKCIAEKCPDQYAKCLKAAKCEKKLTDCAYKCGTTSDNQSCWTLCIGLPGATANAAICALKQGCVSKPSGADLLGLTLM
jgi:hypothetical protein